MELVILIVSLIAFGITGYLTYTQYRKAEENERAKILALGGLAFMAVSSIMKLLLQ